MEAGQRNYVALLNELSQKKCWTVQYEELNTHGPDHTKTFTMRAVVRTHHGDRNFTDGAGRNKKEAKHNAAKIAFSCLEKEEPDNTATTCRSSESFAKLNQANYTCWLNEYAQKNKLSFKAKETTKFSSELNTPFHTYMCQYVCGDEEFPQALGKGKKEAKEAAAKLVYEELQKEPNTAVLDEKSSGEQNQNISLLGSTLRNLKLSSPGSTTSDQNFKGMLNQYCQKTKLVHDYILVEKRGPEHNPEFVYAVVINKEVFPEGCGKTAQEAKHNAAQQACYKMNYFKQFLLNSQSSDQSTSPKDDSSSQPLNIESDDGFSSSKSLSKSQNTSESVIFKDSSVDKKKITNPVVAFSLDVRPKRKLAANFHFSPNRSKEEAPTMNAQDLAKPSVKGNLDFNQTQRSRFLEEFHSITRIGKGGFGHVFKAKRKLEQRYYAVKVVKHTDKAVREVDALASLDHTNIVRYHTAWIEDTAYSDEASDSSSTSNSGSVLQFLYIQMEFCEGKTLCVWIYERNSQPEQNAKWRQEATDIMKQVLEAVKYVHSKKLIHRDLKPANIMIGHKRVVKVVDFGLVTAADTDNDGSALERTKRTGTRSYMSPEQTDQSSYDIKVDIFALGLIYFELLWHLGTKAEKQKIWNNIRIKSFPATFHEKFGFEYKLIRRMLSNNPEERPDANELFSQLDQHITVNHSAHRENRTY